MPNRIAWVSPLDGQSAVGRFSRTIVLALAALPDLKVDLWAVRSDARLDVPGVSVLDLEPDNWEASSREYDRIVYNLGNNANYHGAVFEAYLAAPGVVVMHDRFMLGFFLNWLVPPDSAKRSSRGAARFLALMTHLYGADGRAAARRLLLGESGAFEEIGEGDRFPLVEPCFTNATALVTHSESALRAMSTRRPSYLPAARLSLPFVDEGLVSSLHMLSRGELGLPEDKWILVSTGLLHRTKRVELLLLAIASSPLLRERVLVVAAGDNRYAGTYEVELRELARGLGLSDQLLTTGALDPQHYYSYISVSDACAALRSGQHEAASAALAEQLHFGKAVLVNQTGVFAETPDDVVLKIDLKDEVDSVRQAIESLIGNPDLAAQYGARALRYAKDELLAAGYAERLLRFLGTLDCPARLMEAVHEASDDLIANASAESLDRLSRKHAMRIEARHGESR